MNEEKEYLKERNIKNYIKGLVAGLRVDETLDYDVLAENIINSAKLEKGYDKLQKIVLGELIDIVLPEQLKFSRSQVVAVSCQIADAFKR